MNENIKNSLKNNFWKVLEWDSDFFGFGVAEIIDEKISEKTFNEIMSEIKAEGIKLIYWSITENNKRAQVIAEKYQGKLVDNKTTFAQYLENLEISKDETISEYNTDIPEKKLIDIAIQSGVYSRFNKDKKIPDEKFKELYKLWITNSVNKKFADIVMISTHENEISGFVTVKKDNKNSIIGLIAVDNKHRGKKIGTNLVNAALAWAKENDCTTAQVSTQKENIPACKLYEKCGYKLRDIKKFYHFWIN